MSSTLLSRLRTRKVLVIALAVWMVAVTSLVTLAVWERPKHRAVLLMGWGVILLWMGGCGLAMWRWRDLWNRWAARIRLRWELKFVLGCTVLALLEEAVTTLMTNCAPLFGVPRGQAFITASANYFDVVLYHSVVVFIPMFIAWAVMLRWWRFSPFAVFVLFGLTGTLAEALTFGLQNLASFGFWIFVYGLMVWLPAHWAPAERAARNPPFWAYPVAAVLPFGFIPLMAFLAPWLWLTPKHPTIHFQKLSAALSYFAAT